MLAPTYIDPHTNTHYPLDEPRWRSDDGNPLMVTDLPGIGRDAIDRSARSLWRYRAALPVEIESPVSMGEGMTPLVRKSWRGCELHFKLEWFAPTGSFKDRGASVLVSFLKQLGIPGLLEDSSGNGGAAMSAYGAAAGMRVKILAPESTAVAKVAQMRAFGAEVQLVPGPREESQHEAIRQSETIFYASHNWHPFFLQGTKLLAYELWEDLGFRAPDNIVIPTGAGSNVMGCHIGFSELLRAGQIEKLPRLFASQPINCSPIDVAFNANASDTIDIEVSPTVAEGTAIKQPVRMRHVLQALRQSNGGTVALREEEIVSAVRDLAAIGLYTEPTSAHAAAAAEKLIADGTISREETTVVLLTGSGLKATGFMTEMFG